MIKMQLKKKSCKYHKLAWVQEAGDYWEDEWSPGWFEISMLEKMGGEIAY